MGTKTHLGPPTPPTAFHSSPPPARLTRPSTGADQEQERQRQTEHKNVSPCRTVEDGRERLEADEGRARGTGEELSPAPGGPTTKGARATLLWHLPGVCGEVHLQGASTVVTQRLRWVRASCDPPPGPPGTPWTPPGYPLGHPGLPFLVFIYYSTPTLSDRRCINNANVPFLCVHCQI